MKQEKGYPRRKSIRLPHYDYTQAGAYFVTIVTRKRVPLFGEVLNGGVELSQYGQIARRTWEEIPRHFPNVSLDAFIVMPNHIHGIVFINEAKPAKVGAQHAAPLRGTKLSVQPGSLGAMVRSYKSTVTREINLHRGTPGGRVWQRNYYEHIIRDYPDLEEIRDYVVNNPAAWETDPENL